MNSKQGKPQFSIESIKEVVKKFKAQGFEALTHHDLAVCLSTIGFAEVCKQFGAQWNTKHEQSAQKILADSDYDLSWFGKANNPRYNDFLTLCSRGDIEKAKEYLRCQNAESKAELARTVDNFKRTALHIAVKQGYDVLAEYLINEGFSVNARDRQLKTPLHYCRSELICQVLLNSKAKVIVRDNKYCTPVHYAASGNDYKCLQMMLKNSNVVNQVDATLKTPLFYAVFNSSEQQVNIIRILFQNGAKPNDKDLFGKTPLHYAAEMSKSRCIPILLKKGASTDIRDKHSKTPLDLASNQKVKKIILAYCENKGVIFDPEETAKREQFKQIIDSNKKETTDKSRIRQSRIRQSKIKTGKTNSQIYTQDINQVSTWVREKFFVLMKKLQESGVKALWHLKRPYVYTGSWAQDIDSLQDLYDVFLNTNGPEAAMRAFNILCPYEKPLPTVIGKTEQAFEGFFGQNWFSTDPVQKIRNMHSTSKIKTELQTKMKQNEDLKTELLGYKSQIERLESQIMGQIDQITHYKKIEEQLRKQRTKSNKQYTDMIRLMNQNEQLKAEKEELVGGEEQTRILSQSVEDLKSKNRDLIAQMERMREIEAASRRKCGQIFLKSLAMAQNNQFSTPSDDNLYDDDSIISLYNLLQNNPPNLQKRFKNADRRGAGKLNIDQFTKMLQDLSMLPQDVMSMHRITGFALGRKTLSFEEFQTILENRHKNRPMWQKKLIRKMKKILLENGMTLQKFFTVMDKDGNGTIQATELRKGLEGHNIFMNQTDWSNLFNLLDSDNSGEIDLMQLKTLFNQEKTGKLEAASVSDMIPIIKINERQKPREQKPPKQQESNNEEQNADKQKESEAQKVEQQEAQPQEQQQEFSQPYEEEDSSQEGITRLNGVLKLQLPVLKLKYGKEFKKVYVKFFIFDDIDSNDSFKMADMTKQKLQIAAEFEFIKYKITDIEQVYLRVTVWSNQAMEEDHYLGQTSIQLKKAFDKPGQWGIVDKFKLTAEDSDKPVNGNLVLQVRWTPNQDQ